MEHHDAAQKAFDRARAAIAAAGDHDPYFQLAEADFLLDRQRPALVVERLRNETRHNHTLLRQALAEAPLPDARTHTAAQRHAAPHAERSAATPTRRGSTDAG